MRPKNYEINNQYLSNLVIENEEFANFDVTNSTIDDELIIINTKAYQRAAFIKTNVRKLRFTDFYARILHLDGMNIETLFLDKSKENALKCEILYLCGTKIHEVKKESEMNVGLVVHSRTTSVPEEFLEELAVNKSKFTDIINDDYENQELESLRKIF